MSNKKYMCRYCERTYARKLFYEKHMLLCELNNVNKKDKEARLQELDDTPCLRTLYEMVLELAKQNNDLKKQLDNVNKFINIKKKSISIIDWLNNNFNNSEFTDYYLFINNISTNIREKHLEYIFKLNYINGVKTILEDVFNNCDLDIIPIKAFDQKDNQLYIYLNNKWCQMSNTDFQNFNNIISKKIMSLFIKWQNKNIDKLSDDEFSIEYTKNVQKIMSGNLSNYEISYKLKNKLYKYLKVNIKNIIEYNIN